MRYSIYRVVLASCCMHCHVRQCRVLIQMAEGGFDLRCCFPCSMISKPSSAGLPNIIIFVKHLPSQFSQLYSYIVVYKAVNRNTFNSYRYIFFCIFRNLILKISISILIKLFDSMKCSML